MPPLYLQHVTSGVADLDDLRPDGIPNGTAAGALSLPNCPRRMAGGESIRFHVAIHPGDVITAVQRLASIEVKSGRTGPFVLINYSTTFFRADTEVVAESTKTVIARPPAKEDE
jgi:hydroxyacyl-ACP dehydratase HTD2-like protein with hotdog domain